MKNINYNESIVIPLFQKKIQDLTNNNIVLEANLLVEQNRNKDIVSEFGESINSKDNSIASLSSENTSLREEIMRLNSSSAVSSDFVSQAARHADDLKRLIRDKDSEIVNLKNNIQQLEIMVMDLKEANKKPKIKKNVVLDGSTF